MGVRSKPMVESCSLPALSMGALRPPMPPGFVALAAIRLRLGWRHPCHPDSCRRYEFTRG